MLICLMHRAYLASHDINKPSTAETAGPDNQILEKVQTQLNLQRHRDLASTLGSLIS